VTEEPSTHEEHPEQVTKPDSLREDWFARQLGEEWVEIEPGIYRQVDPPAFSTPESVDLDDPDEQDALVRDLSVLRPGADEAPESGRGGRWWRRG
jgi:hypothetical protein